MKENRDSSLPTGLIWLVIYQLILVVVAVSLGYRIAAMLGVWEPGPPLTVSDVVVGLFALLVLACWGTAIGFASVGMVTRKPRGFLLGMICHLLLECVALPMMLFCVYKYVRSSLSDSNDARAWAPLALLFGLMWMPFVLVSSWAFFYLRRLRKLLFSE